MVFRNGNDIDKTHPTDRLPELTRPVCWSTRLEVDTPFSAQEGTSPFTSGSKGKTAERMSTCASLSCLSHSADPNRAPSPAASGRTIKGCTSAGRTRTWTRIATLHSCPSSTSVSGPRRLFQHHPLIQSVRELIRRDCRTSALLPGEGSGPDGRRRGWRRG